MYYLKVKNAVISPQREKVLRLPLLKQNRYVNRKNQELNSNPVLFYVGYKFSRVWQGISRFSELGTGYAFSCAVVPKSYRLEGQPRSTRNEYPIRSAFGNSRQIQYGDL